MYMLGQIVCSEQSQENEEGINVIMQINWA